LASEKRQRTQPAYSATLSSVFVGHGLRQGTPGEAVKPRRTHDTELRRLIRLEVLILDDFCLHTPDPTAVINELIVESRCERVHIPGGVRGLIAGSCRPRPKVVGRRAPRPAEPAI
jgi:hypothetical protein